MKTFFTQSLLLAGLFSLVTFISCQDDPTAMGLEIKNPGTKVLVTNDSISLINCYTYEAENYISVTTNNNLLLGCQNDPELGTFYNHALVELSPESTTLDFDSLPEPDSLVLTLEFQPRYTIKVDTFLLDTIKTHYSYGDTSAIQKLVLYEIDTAMPIENLNGQELGDLSLNGYFDRSKPIAELTYQIKTSTAVKYNIKLNNELAKRLLADSLYDDFNELVFRGFYIESQSVDGIGAISMIQMNDSSKMVLYYHAYNNGEPQDSLKHTYTFKSTNKANIFKKNLSPSLVYNPMYTEFINAKENSFIYAKNNNALYLKVRIELDALRGDTNVAINRAVLRIPCTELEGEDPLFVRNPSFVAYRYLDDAEYLLYDHTTTNSSGSYAPNPIEINEDYLSVFLTNEVQTAIDEAISDKKKKELIIHIKGSYGTSKPNRTIFKGAQNQDPVRLFITYTTINPL